MIGTIIGALLPVILQIVGSIIKSSNLKKEQKQEYLSWVSRAAKNLGSVRLHNYALKQIEELKAKPFVETK